MILGFKQGTDEWKQKRRELITGTDAPAIMGVGRKTPLMVYLEKTGQAPTQEDNRFLEWGRRLEKPLAEWYEETHGKKLEESPGLIVSDENKHLGCTVDFLFDMQGPVGAGGVYEGKNVNAYAEADWDDTCAPYAYIQLQHNILVANEAGLGRPVDHGVVCALIGGNNPKVFEYIHDKALAAQLMEAYDRFLWHLRKGVPPDPTGMDNDTVKGMYPTATVGKITDLSINVDEWVVGILELQNEKKIYDEKADEIGGRIDAMKNLIKLEMGDAEEGRTPGNREIRYTNVNRAGHYVEPSSYRKLTLPRK